jgi:hypothetical protein
VSATFLAMRLGTHNMGRTPAHLHSVDGVIPVPLDPGPGPPQSSGDGAGDAAALGWNSLARRADLGVIRSAVLGFRSNHATASVMGEPTWTPDEPCYRPRRAGGAAPWAGGDGEGGAAGCSGSGNSQQQQASGPLCSYWRNLRHVGRQLQRHLLLQPPTSSQQQQQYDVGLAAATSSSSSWLGGPPGRGGAGGGGGHGDEEAPDTGPPTLVLYLVPPSDRDEDVVRAVMELCACLAPATPAARAPPAPVPLATPPAPCRREGDAGGASCTGGEAQSQQQQQHPPPHSGPGDGSLGGRGLGCCWAGGEGCSSGAAPSASGHDAAVAGLAGANGGGSAASTPPEPPACSSTTNFNGPSYSSSGAPTCAAGSAAGVSGAAATGSTTDATLLARLGGAALHLYRTASCPPALGAATGSQSSQQLQWPASPQLDLSQLAATDITVQVGYLYLYLCEGKAPRSLKVKGLKQGFWMGGGKAACGGGAVRGGWG